MVPVVPGGGFPLAVLAIGARTCLGATAAASVLGLGDVSVPARLRRCGGRDDLVARVAAVRAIPEGERGPARTAILAADAMRAACAGFGGRTLAALVVVEEPAGLADGAAREDRAWLARVAEHAGIALDAARSGVLPLGRAGALIALQRAAELLHARDAPDAVLVGGVHTPLQPVRERADETEPPRLTASDGRTATLGEAAGFLLLARARPVSVGPAAIDATIERVAVRPSVESILEARRRAELERAAARARGERGAEPAADTPTDAPETESWRTVLGDAGLVAARDRDRLLADVGPDDAEPFLDGARPLLLEVATSELERGEALGDLGAATFFVLAASAILEPGLGLAPGGRIAAVIGASAPRGGVVVLRVGASEPPVPSPSRLAAPSPACSVAESARRELWRHRGSLRHFARQRAAALHLAERDPETGWGLVAPDDAPIVEVPGQDVAARTDELDRSLRELSDSDLWDAIHIERIDRAAVTAQRFVDALPVPPAELAAAGAAGVAAGRGLRAVRSAVVDKAAAVATLRGDDRGREPPPPPRAPSGWEPIDLAPTPTSAPGIDDRAIASTLEAELERGPADGGARTRAEAELLAAEAAEEIATLRVARGVGPAALGDEGAEGGDVDMPGLDVIDARLGRLLRRIEALGAASAGESGGPRPRVLGAVQRVLPPGDLSPSRAFARAFILGSIDDREAAFLATQDLCDAPEPCVRAISDGLALATGGGVTRELVARCAAEHQPGRIGAALAAMGARRAARVGVLVPLLAHGDAPVRAAAARALAFAEPRAIAAQVLLTAATSERDAEPLFAALESLVRLGAGAGLHRARLALEEREHEPAPLLRLIGLAGGVEDVERIAAFAALPAAVSALGWLGAAPGLDVLVRVLAEERGDAAGSLSPRALAAAAALQRITGGVALGDGKITAGALRTIARSRLETHEGRWEKHLQRSPLASKKKLRWGAPWQPEASLDEVEAPSAQLGDRRAALLEAAARSPKMAAVLRDPMDRASLQRAAIAVARSA